MIKDGDRYTWENYGSLQPHLVGCFAAAWVLICLISLKGLKFYGKAAYVITLSPYFVLTILFSKFVLFHFIRGDMLILRQSKVKPLCQVIKF